MSDYTSRSMFITSAVARIEREFARTAFEYAGLDWREYVETDPRYYRPAEPNDLVGDATKARVLPGWDLLPISTNWSVLW